MERRPAVGSKCGVGILHVCQVKDHHQERSDNNIDCSPSHLAHYIKKTVTVRFILDNPVHSWSNILDALYTRFTYIIYTMHQITFLVAVENVSIYYIFRLFKGKLTVQYRCIL